MFQYKSPIGIMYIYLDNNTNSFALRINNTIYGHYHSAAAAADDVYCHVTGCFDWDNLDGTILDAPTDLYEWDKIR